MYNESLSTSGTPGTIHSDPGSGSLSTKIRNHSNDLDVNISTATPSIHKETVNANGLMELYGEFWGYGCLA